MKIGNWKLEIGARATVFTALSPNTEPDDIRLAIKTLFSPWSWRQQTYLDQAKLELAKHYPHQNIHLTSSGRSATFHALQAAGIGTDDEVIIQAFTCIAVPSAITWTGAKPVFADIDPSTYNLDPESVADKITPLTKAIMIQHTFGIPGPIQELRSLADKHNLILIEDCAHALGATYQGQPVGSFGDISILSFGRDKMLSSVFGGAILTSNKNLSHTITQDLSQLSFPPFIWVKQQLLHPILMAIVKRTYFTLAIGKILLMVIQAFRLVSKAVQPLEKTGNRPRHINYQYSPALAKLITLQLKKLPRYTDRRRSIAAQYTKALNNNQSSSFTPAASLANTNPAWLRYPLQTSNPKQLHQDAKQRHIILGDWYNSPVAPSDCDLSKFNYDESTTPHAVSASRQIINLPTYPTMTDTQIAEVIELIRNF